MRLVRLTRDWARRGVEGADWVECNRVGRTGWDRTGAGQSGGLILWHLLPPAASSPPGGGPGTLAGLPAPIGVNGFGPLGPPTNGQPGSDTLYNNGLSPYPGGRLSPWLHPYPTAMGWGAGTLLPQGRVHTSNAFPPLSHGPALQGPPHPCPPYQASRSLSSPKPRHGPSAAGLRRDAPLRRFH